VRQIYLDYSAATPLSPVARKAMEPYLQQQFYNPSAPYLAAKAVAHAVNEARGGVAQALGVRPVEIIFAAGGTEANNLAIHGILSAFPKANIVTSSIEHDAVLAPAAQYKLRKASVDKQGIIELESLKRAIDKNTVLVSVMYANNEVGTIQPLAKIAALLQSIRTERKATGNSLPLYFHTDACQAGAYLDLNVSRLGVDLMTINAGKLYGPKQTGALCVKSGVELHPQILGGGQERGLRSGTENVANIIGFQAALHEARSQRIVESKRLLELRNSFIKELQKAIPGTVVNGSLKHRLPNNVHVTIPGIDNERVMMQLDEAGIQCAVGSACSASNDEPSHVLMAMGISEVVAQSSLRFSMGCSTTEKDVRYTVKKLVKATKT
jgi:cysteine desulfurase